MSGTLHIIIACISAYLLGSIPFGLLLTRLAGLGDIRDIGSGNIGATNVLRTGKKSLAAVTLLFDALKGTVAVLIAAYISLHLYSADLESVFWPFKSNVQFVGAAGILALLGHMYPLWLRFRGGKGVATALGIWLGFSPLVFAGMIVVWLAGAKLSRVSSIGALGAMVLLPFFAFLFAPDYILASFITAALVIWRHRANIRRIMDGSEPRIGETA